MAYKVGQDVVVLHKGNYKDATIVAPIARTEYQVKLDDGNVVHVLEHEIFLKGKQQNEGTN